MSLLGSIQSGLSTVRRAVGLPPITLGNVLKGGAVAGVGAVAGPVAAGSLGNVLSQGWDGVKNVLSQLGGSVRVTADPLTDRVTVTTGATLPSGTVASSTPISAIPGFPGSAAGPSWLHFPWYYWAAAAVVVFLVVRGLRK